MEAANKYTIQTYTTQNAADKNSERVENNSQRKLESEKERAKERHAVSEK